MRLSGNFEKKEANSTEALRGKDNERKGAFFIDSLHVLILFAFALAQPLFDLLTRNAEFLVAHRSQPQDIILLVVLLCLVIPGLFIVLEGIVGLVNQKARKGLHFLIVSGLVAITLLPPLKQFAEVPGVMSLVIAIVLGGAVGAAYMRYRSIRMFLSYLTPALLLFPGLFLYNSDVSKLVFVARGPAVATAGVGSTTPIVMVIFDEFPMISLMDENRQIDPVRYPNFAALAQEAYWFRNATAVAAETTMSVPVILSGRYPVKDGLPIANDYPNNLFTLLAGSYEPNVFESVTNLSPAEFSEANWATPGLTERMASLLIDLTVIYPHILLPPTLTAWLPPVTLSWRNFGPAGAMQEEQSLSKSGLDSRSEGTSEVQALRMNRPLLYSKWVESIKPTNHPGLNFLHIELPHVPWQYFPSGKSYGSELAIDGLGERQWPDDEWLVIQGYQRHLLQLGYTDKLLGDLISHLKAIGLYDRSLIVVTADHGISFRSGDLRRSPTATNYRDIISVPLLIKVPFQEEGVISDRNVETIDILPTIADILSIDIPWPVDGSSALDTSQDERIGKAIYRPDNNYVIDSSVKEIYDSLALKLAIFGSSQNPNDLFRIGPYKSLLGRQIKDIAVDGTANAAVDLDSDAFFANVHLDSQFVPARITGSIRLDRKPHQQLDLAVAVNGTIQAVTKSLAGEGNALKFSAMVPETAFRQGQNDIEVFVVTGSEERPLLAATGRHTALTYTLSSSSEGDYLTTSEGGSIPMVSGAVEGWVDRSLINENDGILQLLGWAVDAKSKQLPESVVVFCNGKYVYSVRTTEQRADVARYYDDDELLFSGFQMKFSQEWIDAEAGAEVRVFAITKDGAGSELKYYEGYPWVKKP